MAVAWPSDYVASLDAGARAAAAFVAQARQALAARLGHQRDALDTLQHVAHGLAWYAAYAATLAEVARWAAALAATGRLGEVERLLSALLFAEYGAQLRGGIAMSQSETIRPWELHDDTSALEPLAGLIALGGTQPVKHAIADALVAGVAQATLEDPGLDDTDTLIRAQFHGFARDRVAPFAQGWHLRDALIPLELIAELAAMGVFGMTLPPAHGGLGMGKVAMCVVSEELSRGWLGVGSLATRAEIAGELIVGGGSAAQQAAWLPRIASGEVLPTAVFTEPDTGSDLGALTTRAVFDGDQWRITGNKTWITHAARADVMMVLARTDPGSRDQRGLSMFIAPKPRGTDAAPFPSAGLSGTEIGVIGYRGMKEYELAFDDFPVANGGLLGGVAGQGFRQLMITFESARIQTAARAVGVGQAALDSAVRYAVGRRQFGRAIIRFPRIANKLAMMAAELMGARQLTYAAARAKDAGRRCDLEAGMAKLVAARAAWMAADAAVQVHGGNGFALDYPASRLLADARILNIFEGASEIQAQVIARRMLDSA